MKKHFLLPAIALMLLANTAKSQDSNPVHVGLKAGANYSKLSLSAPGISGKYATGFSAGAFTRIDLGRAYVQGELLYSKKSGKLDFNAANDQKAKWTSIDIPLLVGYKILRTEQMNLRVFGGAVYSYTINDKTSVLKQLNPAFREFKKSNVGYQAGAGIDLGKLTFDLRYEGALTDIDKTFKSRPQSFQASVGFLIF
ncbi:porin family protein [Pedobacter sp. PLR]|uniref:porin family protein n=1 Tax=Pedobacter sp. PLR TaxID=2994465 RepID=UPI0022472296|nr:porin family protein [Pedobacter sp. PLR]MCX2454104.1 porin family protein [Pedobacter sp. PLR]